MHWDDLRVVRAVYQTGSYARAAQKLGVNETTVPRRLARLERDLGVALFEAVDGQRRPTRSCEEIVALAEPIAAQADKISQVGQTADHAVERRRITATDSFSAYVLAPGLPGFLVDNPEIAVELSTSTANVDFSRWEADIAIRLKRPSKGDFVVSKLMDFELFLVEPANGSGGEQIVCGYPADLDDTPESRFLMRTGIHDKIRCVSKNVLIHKQLIESGSALGVLPSYVCGDIVTDNRFRFSRLPERRSAWLLIQKHLRNDRTTRTVVDWLRSCADSAVCALE